MNQWYQLTIENEYSIKNSLLRVAGFSHFSMSYNSLVGGVNKKLIIAYFRSANFGQLRSDIRRALGKSYNSSLNILKERMDRKAY